MNDEVLALHQRMNDAVQKIETRHDLADFIELLEEAVIAGAFEEYIAVEAYLSGMELFVRDLDGYAMNQGIDVPDQPNWRWMGLILLAAFSHA